MSAMRVRYQTLEFGCVDIHIRSLRDKQQFEDIGGVAESLGISSAVWPLFGVVWASSEVLAHLMSRHDIEGLRILEVGCGIALSSLVLNHRHADITATDYHPEAGVFLEKNVALNEGHTIPFVRTGWADAKSSLGEFDLIIGSDLLYERSHVELLARFIDQHARPHCDIILVDPGRGHHACFSKKMVATGYSATHSRATHPDLLTQPFHGRILRYHREALQ